MAVLVFDAIADRLYETGIEKCVLYLKDSSTGTYPQGVAWNGLTSVSEAAEGGEIEAYYMDDVKYLELRDFEEYKSTLEAYTYPEEFELCDGSYVYGNGVSIRQQYRHAFGLCYKTIIGNDVDGEDYGYKLHLVYNATAAPSDRDYETINDDPEALLFSWDISSVPIRMEGRRPTSELVIDSTKVPKKSMRFLEEALYGTPTTDPYLPLPDEVLALVEEGKQDTLLVDNAGNFLVTDTGAHIILVEE